MPRKRPRTTLHVLAEGLEAAANAEGRLREVDLRTLTEPVRDDVRRARGAAAALHSAIQAAFEAQVAASHVEARARLQKWRCTT